MKMRMKNTSPSSSSTCAPVLPLFGLEKLVRFLDEVGDHVVEILLAIPRAAARAPERPERFPESRDLLADRAIGSFHR